MKICRHIKLSHFIRHATTEHRFIFFSVLIFLRATYCPIFFYNAVSIARKYFDCHRPVFFTNAFDQIFLYLVSFYYIEGAISNYKQLKSGQVNAIFLAEKSESINPWHCRKASLKTNRIS